MSDEKLEVIERGALLDMVWANEAGVSIRVYDGTNSRRVIEIVSGAGSANELVFGKATIEKHNRNHLASLLSLIPTEPSIPAEGKPRATTNVQEDKGTCNQCGKPVRKLITGPPINETTWYHEHNDLVWCNDLRTPLNDQGDQIHQSDDERVNQIRARRAKITSPPWEVGAANDYYIQAPDTIITPPRYVDANMVRPAVCKTIVEVSNQTDDCGEADAYFIANAPEDIDYLLTRLGQVEAERDSTIRGLVDTTDEQYESRIAELEQQVSRLTDAYRSHAVNESATIGNLISSLRANKHHEEQS